MLAGAAVVAAGSVVGGLLAAADGPQTTAATPSPAVSTARVERRALSAAVSLEGTLTFRAGPEGSPYLAIDQAEGVYTELPGAGQVIPQGHVLYRVSGSPVVLLRGATPAYRDLGAGMRGADVAELNADLVALGYASRAQLDPTSGLFGSATTMALERLQAALGLTESGTLRLGQVVFEPTTLRVTAVSAQLGGTAQRGQTVLQGTSTTREVEVGLDVSQQPDVTVGGKVTITLPDDRTTAGVVFAIGKVATCPPIQGADGRIVGATAPGTDSCASASAGSSATPTVTVDVALADPAAASTWDQAPVQVRITTARLASALVVPVTALLARPGGGYAVELVGRSGIHRLVAVSLGLFDDADGLVQVTGSGLTAGDHVVVPLS